MATFPRAKLCRFNDVAGCAPPPGTYQPIVAEKPILGHFNRSQRFVETISPAPPPGTYQPKLTERPPLGHFGRSERFVEPKNPAPRPICAQTPVRERRHSLDWSKASTTGSPGLRRSHSVNYPRPRRVLTSIKRRDKACCCDISVSTVSVAVLANLPCPNCAKHMEALSQSVMSRNDLEQRLKLQTDKVVSVVAKQEAMAGVVMDLDSKVTNYQDKIKGLKEDLAGERYKSTRLREEVKEISRELVVSRDTIEKCKEELDQEKSLLHSKEREHELLVQNMSGLVMDLDSKVKNYEDIIKRLKEDLAGEKYESTRLREEVAEISRELVVSRDTIEKCKVEFNQEKGLLYSKKREHELLVQNMFGLVMDLDSKVKNYEDIIKRLKEDLAGEKYESTRLREEVEEISRELVVSRDTIEKCKVELDQEKGLLHSKEREHELLVQNMSGLVMDLDSKVKNYQDIIERLKEDLAGEKYESTRLREEVEEISRELVVSRDTIEKCKVELDQEKGLLHSKEREHELFVQNMSKEINEKEVEMGKVKEDCNLVRVELCHLQRVISDKDEEIGKLMQSLKEVSDEKENEVKKASDELVHVTGLLCHLRDQCHTKDQRLKELNSTQDETIAKYNTLRKMHEDSINATADNIIELLDDIRDKFGQSEFDESERGQLITSSSQIPDTDPDALVQKYMADLRIAVGRVAGSLVAYRDQNLMLEREVEVKHDQIRELEVLIGPFREQLEFFEQERKALTDVTSKTKKELEEIALQQAACLGHQNHKQKIRYLVQLKEANLRLKDEVNDLQAKLRQKDRKIWRLSKESMRDISTPRGLAYCHRKENSARSTK